ncbi:MAG TPA: triose-phosphate isomerase [Gemmatimonadaceae bacterium]|nr:triose-phosphate isomerase [Gemmatimonadaceae bacterium]
MTPDKRKVFAANWKMHQSPPEAVAFLRAFLGSFASASDRRVLIFPPAVSLHAVVEETRKRPDVEAGVQNIYWEAKGAFTGEISAELARDAGARHVLIGHSERRHVFGETDAETGLKVKAALRAGLTPMICVGETLEEREAGETLSVVRRQLRAAVEGVESLLGAVTGPMIAYEPVWAIGTGKTATPQDAAEVHTALRAELIELCGGAASAADIPILYGGSVKRDNVAALMAASEVGGVLVGGASLEAQHWMQIVSA